MISKKVLLLLVGALAITQSACAADDDVALLLAKHENVLQAHRETNVEMLMEDAALDYTLVTAGEILHPSFQERLDRFSEYFSITSFDRYEDSLPPIVKVSPDGNLGWVIARVSASAVQDVNGSMEQLDFTSAWIELYEKRDGQWVQIGNVSNFKP